MQSLNDRFNVWKPVLSKPARFSYYFIAGTLLLAGWFHLVTPLVASLFAYFTVRQIRVVIRRPWLAAITFVVFLLLVTYWLGFFISHTVAVLPEIANKAMPSIIETAGEHRIELPFTDFKSLLEHAVDSITSQFSYLGSVAKFARGAGTEFVLLLIGIVVAIAVFLDPRMEYRSKADEALPENFYSACTNQIRNRFSTFYRSFALVMGAQIIISGINTVLTGIFVLVVDLPYPLVIVGVTFLCGLLPVIGNLISNTIIFGIGLTVSPKMALIALGYLILIHKFEYFLNSKIVGDRIKNPVWLTLLALVIGERLMGIPGMILAPVILHYIKTEASAIKAETPKPVEEPYEVAD